MPMMRGNLLKEKELNISPVWLFALMAIGYVGGLFVPLMDNDSAHHASIALSMLQNGDWRYLYDHGQPYLDKPHFQFWAVALSFALLGVNAFAYKISSFVFTLLGVFATYKLAHYKGDGNMAVLSALLLASTLAFALANVDVRMDAILTAAIILAIWQGVLFFDTIRLRHLVLSALALAIAFGTKGWVGVMVPAFALLFYLIGTRQLRRLASWQFAAYIGCFFLFIAPVLYAYYVQYDLSPDVSGEHRSGVGFILFGQVTERMGGGMGTSNANDPFFFVHTLLWAILPWSLLFYVLLVHSIAKAVKERRMPVVEWLTLPAIVLTTVAYSVSQFKLPHYINVVFPLIAIYMAYKLCNLASSKMVGALCLMQKVVYAVLIAGVVLLNCYLFPPANAIMWVVAGVGGVACTGLLLLRRASIRNMVATGCLLSSWLWIMMNYNFYPQLLTYQAGTTVSEYVQEHGIAADEIALYKPCDHSYSLDIGLQRIVHECTVADLEEPTGRPAYLFLEQAAYDELAGRGIPIEVVVRAADYRITRLTPRFLMPSTRDSALSTVYLVRLKQP